MKLRVPHPAFNLGCGILLVSLGTLVNPWSMALMPGLRGQAGDPFARGAVGLFAGLAAVAGVRVLAGRRRIRPLDFIFAGGLALVVAGGLLMVDLAMGMLGLPAENLLKYTYSPRARYIDRSVFEFEVPVTINSRGFRSPELPFRRDPAETRLFIVGDSFVQGYGVRDDEPFPQVLERHYRDLGRNVSVINGGKSASGPIAYLNVLVKIGLRFEPRAALLAIYVNDVAQMPDDAGFRPTLKPGHGGVRGLIHRLYPHLYAQYAIHEYRGSVVSGRVHYDEMMDLIRRKASPEAVDRWRANLPPGLLEAAERGEFALGALTAGILHPDYWSASLDLDTPGARRKWENLKKVLDLVSRELSRRRVRLGVVFIPAVFQYDAAFHSPRNPWLAGGAVVRESWLEGTSPLQRELDQWARGAGVPFLDLTAEFRAAVARGSPPLAYFLDTHWTAEGHRLAARRIARWLDETGMLEGD